MFFNIHTRRAFPRSADSNKAGSSARRGIFQAKRRTGKLDPTRDDVPGIGPGLTFSTSEDAEDATLSSDYAAINHDKCDVDKTIVESVKPSITFSESEVLENQLTHMRELWLKDEEIIRIETAMKDMKKELLQRVAEKEEQLAKSMASFEKNLIEKEEELSKVRVDLQATKDELNKVCAVLIKCQHDLFEEQNRKVLFRIFK